MIKEQSFNKLISAYLINSLTEFIKIAPFQHFRQLQKLDKELIQPILAESQQISFSYSNQIKSLFLALKDRVQFNNELINCFPNIQPLLIKLSKTIECQHEFLQIAKYRRGKLDIQLPELNQRRIIVPNSQNILAPQNIRKASYLDKIQFFEQTLSIIQVQDISKIDFIVFTSIYQIAQLKKEIVKNIGAIINSGGGLILFGCEQDNSIIKAHGQIVSQKNKRDIQQQLEFCLSCFYPKISFQDNIELKFIPIKKKQFQNHPSERQYIKDMYVTVLQLWTNYPEKTIFSHIENQKKIFKRKQGKTIQLKGQECHKYIKAKFYNKYMTQQEKSFLQYNYRNTNISLFQVQKNAELQLNYKPYKLMLDSYRLQLKFDYVSALFLNGSSLRTVINHLIFKNIRNFHFHAYSKSIIKDNREIKIQKEPILLFHITTPKKLQQVLENFSTKSNNTGQVKLKNITNSIKLDRYLLKKEFNKALKFLRQKKQTQYLIYYEFIAEESYYYLQTGSKVSFFYLYSYLKQIGFNYIKFRYIEDFNEIKGMQKKFSSSQTP